jgi:hypothetical protein
VNAISLLDDFRCLAAKERVLTKHVARMRGVLTAGLTALVLGAATLMTAAPAQAQYGYHDGYRPRVERRFVERRIVRPEYGRGWYGRRYYGRDCRVVVTRRINRFGERVVTRRRICG